MNPKQSQQQQRSRSRNSNGNATRGPQGGGHKHINIRVQNFDSNGPEGRIRGNAHQVMEKYLALGRDAFSQGDRVAAENFYQHAEHYLRLINAYNQNTPAPRRSEEQPTEEASATGGVSSTEEGSEAEANVSPLPMDGAVAEPSQPAVTG